MISSRFWCHLGPQNGSKIITFRRSVAIMDFDTPLKQNQCFWGLGKSSFDIFCSTFRGLHSGGIHLDKMVPKRVTKMAWRVWGNSGVTPIMSPEVSQGRPRRIETSFWHHCGTIFHQFWTRNPSILGLSFTTFWQSVDTYSLRLKPSTTKMAGIPPCILNCGGVFQHAEYRHHRPQESTHTCTFNSFNHPGPAECAERLNKI